MQLKHAFNTLENDKMPYISHFNKVTKI